MKDFDKEIEKRIKEVHQITKLDIDVIDERVCMTISYLKAVENKSEQEILDEMIVEKICGQFHCCSECGSFEGTVFNTSMNREYDCGEEIWICSNKNCSGGKS